MRQQNLTIRRILNIFKNSDQDDWIASEVFRIIDGQYRFSELSSTAKNVAAKTYWKGLEGEQQQELTWRDCLEFCADIDNDITYKRNGSDYEII